MQIRYIRHNWLGNLRRKSKDIEILYWAIISAWTNIECLIEGKVLSLLVLENLVVIFGSRFHCSLLY